MQPRLPGCPRARKPARGLEWSQYERIRGVIGGLEISLEALRHNAALLRDLVGARRTAFVLKGNAYGHGLAAVAAAVAQFASRLCVYRLEEAIALREAGIALPVVILGPVPPEGLEDALAAKAEVALWSTGEFARRLCKAARNRQCTAAVHVKVNTDLNRLGFEPHELTDAVEEFLRLPELCVAGIFSHLASAEELNAAYTMHQLATFERALAGVKTLLERREMNALAHIAASAAAMLWPQTRLDLARFGIALYGLMPSPQTLEALTPRLDLRPALSYRSKIVVVRTIAAGASVGYGGSFHAPRDMRIGVVPAGYADGIPRALSNRGAFVVDGALCPIVGRVAMNMTEIDLTQAPNARVGSSVTLIGNDANAAVTADDWAQWSETINYEIVTRLPAELPRTFTGKL